MGCNTATKNLVKERILWQRSLTRQHVRLTLNAARHQRGALLTTSAHASTNEIQPSTTAMYSADGHTFKESSRHKQRCAANIPAAPDAMRTPQQKLEVYRPIRLYRVVIGVFRDWVT